jgi:acyl-CoA reductase-like NAD-dependent aldehyde dehydrogenase
MSEISLLINGQRTAASNGATFERCNPLDGSVATVQDAVAAVEAASKAFPAWSAMGPTERRALLTKAAHALEAKAPAFRLLLKPWRPRPMHPDCGRVLTCIWRPAPCSKPPR